MAGLGLIGALGGLGQGILQQAEDRRQDALRDLERQWQLQDRDAAQTREDAVYGRRRSDALSDYARARSDALSDEQRGVDRAAARTAKVANVYESIFGTESGGNFGAANSEGYVGRSQFGQERLDDFTKALGIGRITTAAFLADPELQKRAEAWHFADIDKAIDADDLMRFDGATINGVRVSRSGMIAAAHLGGLTGMRRFLESGGQYDPKDSNGTNLSDYMRTHGGLSTDRSGVWEVIADPETPESVRDDLRAGVGMGAGMGAGADTFTNQVWVRQGDGTMTRMGYRKSDGAYMPVPGPDGQPLTQAAAKVEPSNVDVSPAAELRVTRKVTEAAAEGFIPYGEEKMATDAILGEVRRLMAEDGMSEAEAEKAAWASMTRTTTTVPGKNGWFVDTPETTVSEPWDGTFAARIREEAAVDYDHEASRAAARAAIATGAPRADVIARLKASGISTDGL